MDSLDLTPAGEAYVARLKKLARRDISKFILLELWRSRPIAYEDFLSYMDEKDYDMDYVRDVLADLHFAGYIT